MRATTPWLAAVAALAAGTVLFGTLPGTEPLPTVVLGALGRGTPIVMLPGLGSGTEHWLPVARRLAVRHRVVLVDLPGHALSGPIRELSVSRVVAAVDAALGGPGGATTPFVLVGHSVGGLVAAAYAIEHPARVRGLVLVETSLAPQGTRAERDAMLRAVDADYPAMLHDAYTSFGRDSAQGEALYRRAARLDSASIKPWIRLVLTADVSGRAGEIRMPALAIVSDRTWPAGEPWPVTAEALGCAAIPRLRAERLAGCGHFVMLDRPDAVARSIERFAAERRPDVPG